MISKPLIVGILSAGCLTAAAGGAYVAVRQNAADSPAALAAPTAEALLLEAEPIHPVAETEAVVAPEAGPVADPRPAPAAERPAPSVSRPAPTRTVERRPAARPIPAEGPPARTVPEPLPTGGDVLAAPHSVAAAPLPVAYEAPLPPAEPLPALPEREFVEVVVPASSVIGLQVETSLSSERARIEDRVEARVTRDVTADGRIAIPAGSRVVGSVTIVERGGKLKERSRLGVRFHTLVLANGLELPIRTEAIVREGDSPGNESARKIGGAAAGGAILGAILGGGKGAIIGGATGAAGGTAAVMAGDRNPATLASGTVLTVRLTSPVSIDVEKR